MANYISEAKFAKALFKVCNGDTITINRIVDILKNNGTFKKDSIDIMYLKYTGDETLLEEFNRGDVIRLRKTISVLEGDESILSKDRCNGVYVILHFNDVVYNYLMTKSTYDRFKSWLYEDCSYEYNRVWNYPSFTFVLENESSVVIFRDKITMVETFLSEKDDYERYKALQCWG